ncbi:amino acid ABC transporter substrate-binding protein, PAAT family [Tistlia consotensis]|uniref:Amino acid ABC transporter substrate-binding protein, PAAT family n=1 Tax=Tistlia consotensis USBA 355 TaxID=560819 RepID=A0A1Y6CIU6_9PROT|nr:transporter substrate-binding domain-containing protein [Tistlia consotensis]SMF68755.1 amino acid ABC transporter substrate-binding protein, PAAT family [Tistlia consotensis USBA 355]SNS01330.1 amino acid ABC transporter substrate-binding protein, PAAT family [Tistlia consotensis]
MIRRTFFTALTLAAAVGLAQAAVAPSAKAGATLDRVMQSKTLKVATDPAYPPQSAQKPDGSFEGFDIDVATEIAKRLGAKVEFVTPAWDVITAGHWGSRWDLSVGSMTPTKQRAEVLDFPAVYYYTPASFFVHKDAKYTKVEELDGKKIGVCAACTYEDYLRGTLKIDAAGVPPFKFLVKPGEIRTYDTDLNVMDDLRLGDGVRLDAGLSALPTVQGAIKSGYPLKVLGDPVFYEPLAVAADKGDAEFDAKLKSVIAEMHKDGTLSELSKKWYGVDLTSAGG